MKGILYWALPLESGHKAMPAYQPTYSEVARPAWRKHVSHVCDNLDIVLQRSSRPVLRNVQAMDYDCISASEWQLPDRKDAPSVCRQTAYFVDWTSEVKTSKPVQCSVCLLQS